ncbi:MBL fold metallo-hydrolase [Cerasicoccus frondis]|uniref:MBL fold metallo-hydrolase n=1 Tax=Cerasicoccus frondis TaxID=490090 RepID=UPI0028528AEE|nr:hypothetical protein [Cerasicoccus frondis]
MECLFDNIHNVYRDQGCKGFGHSYLLKRAAGNVLLPRMGPETTIEAEYDAIKALGGLEIIFVTDYHFGGGSTEQIAQHFDARSICSSIEKPKLKKRGLHQVEALAYERQFLADDLECIPVPGHTSGGFCLLWTDTAAKYLFTGDFLYFDGHTWVPGAKTRRKIEASLQLLKDLEYDYLVGCGSDGVSTPHIELRSETEKVKFIDQILARFKQ